MSRTPLAAVALLLASPLFAQDVNEATERGMKAASARVAPSVVKIETAGGLEVVKGAAKGPAMRKGLGPTTGVVVDPDGYIISSSFNFAAKPTDIFVTVPGRPTRLVAKIVAADQTRMLTLLKVDAKDLPVPTAFPKKEMLVGQWALALGRTLDPNADRPPSMSAGIVSATGRIWGKMLQTDAKISPVNYGGPLIAIDGRVFGILVPASSRGEGETAGVEGYDSGIGFAVPLEDVFAAVPKLKGGKDLRRGLLGITPQGTDVYNAAPVIGAVQPDSAAARAGIQLGDKILEIDGKPIPNYSAVQHVLGPRYEGDTVSVKVSRGGKDIEFKNLALLGTATSFVNAFFGVLPMRDESGAGVTVRYVYPKSPADVAGVKAGDRILKFGPSSLPTPPPVPNRAALLAAIGRLTPGTEVKFEVKRKVGDKSETLTAKLAAAGDELPEDLPLPSSGGKALEGKPKEGKGGFGDPMEEFENIAFVGRAVPDMCGGVGHSPTYQDKKDEPKKDEPKKDEKKTETGFLKRTNEALGREYWVYVPENYDPNVSHGLIVWFHPAGQGGKDGEKMKNVFRDFCEDHHFIVMGPKSGNNDGWLPSESEAVMTDVKAVLGQYTIDKARVAAHGLGQGGQMAFYLGFNARDVFRGVGAVGAVLGTAPKENVAGQPLSFFVAGGDKDPLIKDIAASKEQLSEKRFPVVFREMKQAGKEYFDQQTFADFLAWLDSLDRI